MSAGKSHFTDVSQQMQNGGQRSLLPNTHLSKIGLYMTQLTMTPMKKVLASFPVILAATAIYISGICLYMYYKPAAKTISAAADYELSAADLYKTYDENSTIANKWYTGKVVVVYGKVLSVSKDAGGNTNVSLMASPDDMFGVTGEFAPEATEPLSTIRIGETVSIKGEVAGKLDVGDVVLKYASLVEN